MKHVFVDWGSALRSLVLRSSPEARTASPVAVPPGLEPPPRLADAENGYVALTTLVQAWPSEGHTTPDLLHRLQTLPNERTASERALAPLRPMLEGVDRVLAMPHWQVRVDDAIDWPEMTAVRRLGQALLLRAALDARAEDRERAIALARRVRRSQGPFFHFLMGSLMERDAGGSFEGIGDDRREAVRWGLARIVVPFVHRLGPWDPPLVRSDTPSVFEDQKRACAWALSGHPEPYDPVESVQLFLRSREALEGASSESLQRLAQESIVPWPPELMVPGGFGGAKVSLLALRRARPDLLQTANPYGRLQLAQFLYVMGGTAAMIERALGSRSDGGT